MDAAVGHRSFKMRNKTKTHIIATVSEVSNILLFVIGARQTIKIKCH